MYVEGDFLTFAFDEERYLLGKIVQIEKLTLHDLTHIIIYDVLLEAGPPGYDTQGEYMERTHELPDTTTLPVLVDHIALTPTALEESDAMIVGHEEVTEEERRGHAIWVALRRERAEQRGLIRYDTEEEEWEEEWDEDELGDEEGDMEVEEEEVGETSSEEIVEVKEVVETIEVETHTWHDTIFEIPLGQAMLELSDIFQKDEFRESVIAQAIDKRIHANRGEITALIRKLVDDGDYGAGQELLVYGDSAADLLYEELLTVKDPQNAEDILQILADMGNDRAYQHIGDFFERHLANVPDDPIALAAARSFCYVVMLTGGTPEPLATRLNLIEQLDYPELEEDVESAISAIKSQGAEVPGEPEEQSGPFGGLV